MRATPVPAALLLLASVTVVAARPITVQGARGKLTIIVHEEADGPAAVADPAAMPTPSARGLAWRPVLEDVGQRHGLDPQLLEAVVAIESNFRPDATSAAGALGLMQIMPGTAHLLGLDDPLNPAANLDAGARHLAQLLDQFDGEEPLALAAYNAGPGAVRRAKGVPHITETARYVRKVAHYLAALGAPRAWVDGLPEAPSASRREDASSIASLLVNAEPPPPAVPAGPPVRLLRDERGRVVLTNQPGPVRRTTEPSP